jgi:hypothetical protein
MVPAEGFRQKKEFNPRSAEGEILTYTNVKHVDFSKKESFMVLSRIRNS